MAREIALGRITGPLALLVLVGVILVALAYAAGMITTLGYESRHLTFTGVAGGTRSGGGFGLKRMLFFEGQTFWARYNAEVREGSLRIGVLDLLGHADNSPHYVYRVTASGHGEATYRIPKTSLYSIYFEGSPIGASGSGFDVRYTVHWGAR